MKYLHIVKALLILLYLSSGSAWSANISNAISSSEKLESWWKSAEPDIKRLIESKFTARPEIDEKLTKNILSDIRNVETDIARMQDVLQGQPYVYMGDLSRSRAERIKNELGADEWLIRFEGVYLLYSKTEKHQLFSRALTLMHQSDSLDAVFVLEKLIKLDPSSTEVSSELYKLYCRMAESAADTERAVRYYGKAVELRPDLMIAKTGLALARQKMEDESHAARKISPEEEIKYYSSLKDKSPADRSVISNLAEAYRKLGVVKYNAKDYTGAVEAETKALELQSDNQKLRERLIESLKTLGVVKYNAKDYTGAIEAETKALALQPDNQKLKDNLSSSLYSFAIRKAEDEYDYTEAIALLTRALKLSPNNKKFSDWIFVYKITNNNIEIKEQLKIFSSLRLAQKKILKTAGVLDDEHLPSDQLKAEYRKLGQMKIQPAEKLYSLYYEENTKTPHAALAIEANDWNTISKLNKIVMALYKLTSK